MTAPAASGNGTGDLVPGAQHVGHINQAGVGLLGLDPGEHIGDLFLLADGLQLHAGGLFELLSGRTAGDLRGADHSARSLSEAIFLGLPGATAIVRVLVAKLVGSPATRRRRRGCLS